MSKERFKVTVKDRVTGEKTTFYAHSAGFQFNMKVVVDRPEVVRMVLDHPRLKKNLKK